MKKYFILLAVLLLFYGPLYASENQSFKDSINKACARDLTNDELSKLIKTLFISCTSNVKVDDLVELVRNACGKEIPKDEATNLIKSMFLSCIPGTKVELVKNTIKKSCGKNIDSALAQKYVRDLFLTCASGQHVDLDGCNVTCLKKNAGAVVGNTNAQ